jgi:hypothetical protein
MNLGQLLLVIFTYNLLTFGNGGAVLALLQHRLVDSGILNLDQFLYAYALGRVTPGQTLSRLDRLHDLRLARRVRRNRGDPAAGLSRDPGAERL